MECRYNAISCRRIDRCCVQESRWKGCSAKLILAKGFKYKFIWSGDKLGFEGVRDFNGHAGKAPEDFNGVHDGRGFGSHNADGRRILDLCTQSFSKNIGKIVQVKKKP